MHTRVISIFTFSLLLFACCSSQKERGEGAKNTVSGYHVEPAPEWTALFNRTSGWFGGDGIFAIPFSGNDADTSDSLLFLFSDTLVGEIENDSLTDGFTMINNSVMILQGREPAEDNARFLLNPQNNGTPASLFVPTTPNAHQDDYYWLGDGFVNPADDNLYIFAYRIRNTNDGSPFPFRETGNCLIIIPPHSKYPFTDHRQVDLPFSENPDSLSVSFGVGVLPNVAGAGVPNPDGYVYVYGIRGKNKELLAARAKAASFEDFSMWEFYTGNGWSSAFGHARPVADSVSNELSVTPVGDSYTLVYQYSGLMPTIYMQTGPSPAGPFGQRQEIWNTTDDIKEKDLFTYNAKAHPAISGPGELLVSYNVNSFNFFEQIEEIPNLYRPRFVRIVFEKN